MNNYDELRQAGRDAIAEDDHVCITGELLLQLLDENEALRKQTREADDAALLHDDWCRYREQNELLRAALVDAQEHMSAMQRQAGRCPRCEGIEEAITEALGDAS